MNDKKRWYVDSLGGYMYSEGYSGTPHKNDTEMHAPVALSAVVVEEGTLERAIAGTRKGERWKVHDGRHLIVEPGGVWVVGGGPIPRDGWYLLDSPKPEAKEEAGTTPNGLSWPDAKAKWAADEALEWAKLQPNDQGGRHVCALANEVKRLRAIVEAPKSINAVDLLTPEERAAAEHYRPWSSHANISKLIAALDRIAPAPAPEWRPEKGERVRWHLSGESGTGIVDDYDHADTEWPYTVKLGDLSLCVERVSPLEEKP